MELLSNLIVDTNLPDGGPVLDVGNRERFSDGFRALGDPHRLSILHLLLTCGEMCVCECIPALGISQSNLSFHLKTLRQAGFITVRKSGKWMYYSLNRPVFERFLASFSSVFDFENWLDKPECTACEDTEEVVTRIQGGTGNANE